MASQTVIDMYFDQNYAGIVNEYENITEESYDQEDYYYYSYALRKQKNYEQGHMIAKKGMMKYHGDEKIINVYCWCLYYMYIKDFKGNYEKGSDFNKAVEAILHYGKQGKFTPYVRAVFEIVKRIRGNTADIIDKKLYYLEKIDAKNLSTESSSFVSDGKTRIVASEKEQWFSLMSKILFEKKQYDQCLLLCEEALASFPQLHYNNDIWFPNRIANCYLEKGKIKEAANKLEELMKHKENWVVYDSMFKVKQAQNDLQGMLKYASAALLATGEDKSKIKLVLVFGKVLQDNGMTEQAFLHYIFARNIRLGAGWPDDNMLLKTIAQFGLAEPESKTIKKQLGLFWKQQRHGGEVLYHGVIDKILPNNKAGFIKDAKGKSYYFRISSFKADKMKLGTAVQFYVEESFDRKKNKNSQCAVDVTVVQ